MIRISYSGILICAALLSSCSRLQDSVTRYRIDREMSVIFKPDMPGTAVIAVKDNRVLYRNSFGLANVELSVKMKPDMCFKIGSISKQFTATAILMLEERGLLSLDDKMTEFLPDCPPEHKDVKIKHLLSHTSGIKNYSGYNDGHKIIRESYSPNELVNIILGKPLDFSPGEKWEYSNSNYTILAFIIETITGMGYHDFIYENIFHPCMMQSTCFTDNDKVVRGLVNGYRVDGSGLKNSEYMSMTHTFGAGDVISCIDDLAKWNKALLSCKLISRNNLFECFTRAILNDGSEIQYGIGWFMDNYRNMTNYYHDGGVYGFQSICTYIADEDLYIVLLLNRSDIYLKYPPNVICNMIADHILGFKNKIGNRIAIDLSEEQLEKYTGFYQFLESPGKRKISLIEGKLYYERPPRNGNEWSKNEIKPESVYSFYAEGKKSTIIFEFNEENEVVGMNINQAFGRVVKLRKTND